MTSNVASKGRNRRTAGILLLIGFLATTAGALVRHSMAVELKGPQGNDRFIARAVSKKLEEGHLTRHALDTEISERFFKTFLKTLDPYKYYFTKEDFDEFKMYEDHLCEPGRKGDIGFAYLAFPRLLKRVEERMKLVDELLDEKNQFDFTADDQYVTDAEKTVYATTADEIRDKWVKRIKYDLLMQEVEKTPAKEAREKLSRRYHAFAKRMRQINGDDLLELYLTALTSSLDPHTSYMSATTLDNFTIMMKAELDGIGASLQDKDGVTTIAELVPGGAAELNGQLKAKDRVIGVGQGENGDVVDTVDMSLSDVVKLIRGKRGTIVRLKIIPVGKVEPKIINITRAKIELKNSEARGEILEDGKKAGGEPYRIGFIDLPGFYADMEGARRGDPNAKSATVDMRRILDEFNDKHVDVVVVDLRRNGGGSLVEAISLTGLFVDQGAVVQVKDSDGQVKHYDTPPDGSRDWKGPAWRGPLVVLQSKFSASASEIFAGAIQDYRRGLVVGDHSSHGKGTVQSMLDVGQQLFGIPNGQPMGALKITIQQFYRPDGDSTQLRGVVSDVEIPSISTHLPVGESDLDYALKFDHVDPAPYTSVGMVDKDLVKQIETLSADRIAKSADFKKTLADIARYEARKDRKSVSLNREKFMADRGDVDTEKEEEDREREESGQGNRPVVKRDAYVNEALAIAEDYTRLSKVKELAQTK